jgi:hypothetical protein
MVSVRLKTGTAVYCRVRSCADDLFELRGGGKCVG